MANPDATVLVVDDDPDVLMVASTALANQGYKVLEANSGADALRLLHEQPGVSLLFTDIVMPGRLNGIALASELRARDPAARILFTSGFSSPVTLRAKIDGFDADLISKPYRKTELAFLVRSVLNKVMEAAD